MSGTNINLARNNLKRDFKVGDFVLYQYSKKETVPGSVKEITTGGSYIISICLNRSKTEDNLMDIVEDDGSRLRPMKMR